MVKNAFQLAETVVGQVIDMDGMYGGQCADLANWVGSQYGVPLYGNGNQIGIANGPNLKNVADVIPYSAGVALQIGDVLSLGGGTYGHVLVYGGGPLNKALIIDQNYAGVQRVQKRTGPISNILRIVRFKNQEQYVTGSSSTTVVSSTSTTTTTTASVTQQVPEAFKKVYEITCAEVKGIRGNDDPTVLDTFYKCNKVIGEFAGNWFVYRRFTGDVGYIPANCVSRSGESTKPVIWAPAKPVNVHTKFPDETYDGLSQVGTQLVISVEEFIRKGRINYLGYEWMYDNKEDFRNPDKLSVRINAHGFLVDHTDKIVLNMPEAYQAVNGTVLKTPFGAEGIVRASHTTGGEVIVYIK